MSFHKFIFLAGVRFRNPTLWKHYNDLKDSEKWDLAKLEKVRTKKLLEFLEHAARFSPYYNKIFSEIGWTNEQKVTMDLFKRIPVSTKEILIEENDTIHTVNQAGKLFDCETSGTSGQVLTFRRNESWDSFNRASILRGYSWYGVNPWDFNLYFWGYNFKFFRRIKLRLMDFLVNRYRLFTYTDKSIRKLVSKINKTVYIEGYSSMIYELACAAESLKLNTSGLKMVKGTSEKIFPHYVDKSVEVFGKKLISEYGAAETGIIAFECKEGNMHVNMEGVYVETDENDEIIITNYHSYSFPVIRYKLGDAVKIRKEIETCKCGMNHPVIEEVTGRIGKLIYGKHGVYPGLTFYYIFKNLYFQNQIKMSYQAHQVMKGYVEIRLKEPFNYNEELLVRKECSAYFGNDLEIELIQSNNFRSQGGKFSDFISSLN